MKKLLVLFLFAGLAFSTTSCKKDESCPETKLHGAGTWKVTDIKDENNQTLTDQTEYSCLANDQLVLNDSQDGTSWSYTYYLQSNATCGSLGLDITSWAENYNKKKLYVTVRDSDGEYSYEFDYVDEDHIKINRIAGVNASQSAYTIYTFYMEKQ